MNHALTALPVIDSGLASGVQNNATDRRWLRLHATHAFPGALRFYRSTPTASIGRHQAVDRELRLDYCRARGIQIVRRMSGGGALYMDPGQLGFSLILKRPYAWSGLGLAHIVRLFCLGLSGGLKRLGVDSSYKTLNDLEVDGRKIASLFAAEEGRSLLVHGILLMDADIKTMLEALRAPTEKLSADGLAAARNRLVTLADCLGSVPSLEEICGAIKGGIAGKLGFEFHQGGEELAESAASGAEFEYEVAAAHRIDWRDNHDDPIEALWKTGSGTLWVRARFEPSGEVLRRVEFAGDLSVRPADLLEKLQGKLTGVPTVLIEETVSRFFEAHSAELGGLDPLHFARLLRLAVDKRAVGERFNLAAGQTNALMVHSPGGVPAQEILQHASVMLVPYCAKPAWCQWRHLDGCDECGLCEVGDAYRLGRERGMRVVTVTDYEHLVKTLGEMNADGVEAYVGMCCGHFFLKRHRAFREGCMPALLMDISGANCYELKQESEAYAGRFEAEARLDADLLERVMAAVPPRKTHVASQCESV